VRLDILWGDPLDTCARHGGCLRLVYRECETHSPLLADCNARPSLRGDLSGASECIVSCYLISSNSNTLTICADLANNLDNYFDELQDPSSGSSFFSFSFCFFQQCIVGAVPQRVGHSRRCTTPGVTLRSVTKNIRGCGRCADSGSWQHNQR
jgi:hypothetical protein